MTKTYIIFDLEATCWTQADQANHTSEIIEIGAIKVDQDLHILDRFQMFVKPVLHPVLSEYCKELTHITQFDVDQAPDLLQALLAFQHFCGYSGESDDPVVLISWGAYDRSMLVSESARAELHIPFWHLNLKALYSHLRRVNKQYSLEKALTQFGISRPGTAHRALADSETALLIFKHLKQIHDPVSFDQGMLGLSYHSESNRWDNTPNICVCRGILVMTRELIEIRPGTFHRSKYRCLKCKQHWF